MTARRPGWDFPVAATAIGPARRQAQAGWRPLDDIAPRRRSCVVVKVLVEAGAIVREG